MEEVMHEWSDLLQSIFHVTLGILNGLTMRAFSSKCMKFFETRQFLTKNDLFHGLIISAQNLAWIYFINITFKNIIIGISIGKCTVLESLMNLQSTQRNNFLTCHRSYQKTKKQTKRK